jgi:hypothetical protein
MSVAKANGTGTYNFASYLSSLYIKPGEKCTHTRLKDVELGIKGGAYLIPESELEDFYRKYYIFYKRICNHQKKREQWSTI